MQGLVMGWVKDRRRAQRGTTLIELLVSVVIIGLALALIIGTFSTGLLDSVLAKRNTAAVGVVQYELDAVTSSAYSGSALPYSDCFATEDVTSPPATLPAFQDPCPSTSYTLRADVTVAPGPSTGSQLWTITVISWPDAAPVGSPVQIVKAPR
jgi:prepilin-type N-terminal cleavage/methylation domain-containing protein